MIEVYNFCPVAAGALNTLNLRITIVVRSIDISSRAFQTA